MVRNSAGLEVDDVELVGLDRLGMTAKCERKGQFFKMRLPFPREAASRKDVKTLIVALVSKAF